MIFRYDPSARSWAVSFHTLYATIAQLSESLNDLSKRIIRQKVRDVITTRFRKAGHIGDIACVAML